MVGSVSVAISAGNIVVKGGAGGSPRGQRRHQDLRSLGKFPCVGCLLGYG